MLHQHGKKELGLKAEIKTNINAGIYKLVMKNSNDRDIWKTFAMIQKADGSMIHAFYCCIHCEKIFKTGSASTSNLYRHLDECPKNKKPGDKIEPDDDGSENKAEIKAKLNTGIYKLAIKKHNHAELWKNIAIITKAVDGSIIDGYYCCIICSKILQARNLTANLYRHFLLCRKQLNDVEPKNAIYDFDNNPTTAKTTTINKVEATETGSHNFEDDIEYVIDHQESEDDTGPEIINSVDEKETGDSSALKGDDEDDQLLDTEKYRIRNSVWQKFSLNLTDDGRTELFCCQCRMELKYNYKSELSVKEHKCLSADKRNCKLMPSQRDIEEKLKPQISNKIKAGIFKLTKNERKRSLAWKVFDLITTTNGTTLADYTCCSICKKVFKCQSMHPGRLLHHNCYTEFVRLREAEMYAKNSLVSLEGVEKDTENIENGVKDKMKTDSKSTADEIDLGNLVTTTHQQRLKIKADVKAKLNAGIYKLALKKHSHGELWKNIAIITKSEDGTIVNGYYCCIHCSTIFQTNNHQAANLYRHFISCRKTNTNAESKIACYDVDKRTGTEKINTGQFKDAIEPNTNDKTETEHEIYPKALNAINETGCNESKDEPGSEQLNSAEENEPNKHDSYELETDDTITAAKDKLLEDEKCRIWNSTVWQTFALILTDEGKVELTCRQCKMLLKYDYKSDLRAKEHECLSSDERNLKLMPSQRDIEEKLKPQITDKLTAGIFKLTKNLRKRSLLWKVFELITTTNGGSTVEDFTCCSICTKVLKFCSMDSCGLYQHNCYIQFVRLRELEMDATKLIESLEGGQQTLENIENCIKNKIRANSKIIIKPMGDDHAAFKLSQHHCEKNSKLYNKATVMNSKSRQQELDKPKKRLPEHVNELEIKRRRAEDEEQQDTFTLTAESNTRQISNEIRVCFSKVASTAAVGNNENDLDFEDDPKIMAKAKPTIVEEEIVDGFSICVKEEYDYSNSSKYTELDLGQHFPNQPSLPVTVKVKEDQNIINTYSDTHSNENIEIKKELNQFDNMPIKKEIYDSL